MMSTIYEIRFKPSGMRYVGRTRKRLSVRWGQHCGSGNSLVGRAIRNAGISNVTIRVIESCEHEDAPAREMFWILKLGSIWPNGYNLDGPRTKMDPGDVVFPLVGGASPKAADKASVVQRKPLTAPHDCYLSRVMCASVCDHIQMWGCLGERA